jgi:1-deoxy-D-xylulose-5-phosphate synthase
MGLTYLGPVDGNDYEDVEKLLIQAKELKESVIVHVKTTKGKGYEPAENAPASYHSMTPAASSVVGDKGNFSRVMGHALAEMGESDNSLLAITAAMSDGTGLEEWRKRFPDRFFDVGIAEGHALTFAAGLAANGKRPCVAVYSTFMQRAYDNVIHDVALQKLPVLMMIDRAGLNAGDGATHHGIFDVAFFSHIPNVRIYTPISYRGLLASMQEAVKLGGACAIRYPSGSENASLVERFYAEDADYSQIGVRCDFTQDEQRSAVIVTHGRIAAEAVKAAEELGKRGVSTGIILLEMLKPYDESARLVIEALPQGVRGILFLEEEIRSGGMGMNLLDKTSRFLEEKKICARILATDDDFVEKVEVGSSIFAAAGWPPSSGRGTHIIIPDSRGVELYFCIKYASQMDHWPRSLRKAAAAFPWFPSLTRAVRIRRSGPTQ